MSTMVDLNETNFEQEVLQSREPVLIDFWAPWCGPCRQFAPFFEESAQQLAGEAKFARLNIDDNAGIAERYDVKAIPQLLLFSNGQVTDRIVGFAPTSTIASMVRGNTSGAKLKELTDADFAQVVERNPKPVFAAFGTADDGIYRTLMDSLENVPANLSDRATFYKVNTERSPILRERYNVRETSVLLFNDGEVVDRLDGEVSEETLVSMLSSIERMAPVAEVRGAEFDGAVLQSDVPVLVDVWAPWAGSFRRAAAIVADNFTGRIQYLKLNTESDPDIAERYGTASSENCLLLFKRGQVVAKIYGIIGGPYLPAKEVISTLEIWEDEADRDTSVQQLSKALFEERVLQNQETMLVYTGTPWMGSYHRVAHLIEENFSGRVKLFKLDVNENAETLKQYGINAQLPFLLFFKDGKLVQLLLAYFTSSSEVEMVAELNKHLTA